MLDIFLQTISKRARRGRLTKTMISDRVMSEEERKGPIQDLCSLTVSFNPYFGYVTLDILCLWMRIHVLFDALWTSNGLQMFVKDPS